MCHTCLREFIVFHQWKESQEECVNCNATDISKSLNNTFITKIKHKDKQKVGDLTNDYIESNKEVLKELQKEAKQETYE
jgi:hypothetical protein